MMRHLVVPASRLLVVAALTIVAAGGAQAQKLRPGLWENAVSMKSSDQRVEQAMAQMRAQLASMPPAQRAQVEQMMASQGVGIGGAGKPNTVRSCISPEMAARNEFNPGDSRCQSIDHKRTGNVVRFRFSCQNEGTTSQGEGEFTLVSDTETRGKMFVNTQRQGQSMRMDMESTSKWVAADCGNLKPLAQGRAAPK
ncbi:MAG: DUF3617 domain-containing protein [Betaproteobacteria bacterium]|nr:DUF3617 domain-containing protein [Betaproteobacteria bacterium]MCC6249636.1 DUF3617 domain-containing protein [Rubrivivax sp.]MCL4696316.1 DUF3617 family protein [Burkholderiaceae bacterium]